MFPPPVAGIVQLPPRRVPALARRRREAVHLSDLGLEENALGDLSEKAWLELPAAAP
jgi:hypothetical protein